MIQSDRLPLREKLGLFLTATSLRLGATSGGMCKAEGGGRRGVSRGKLSCRTTYLNKSIRRVVKTSCVFLLIVSPCR